MSVKNLTLLTFAFFCKRVPCMFACTSYEVLVSVYLGVSLFMIELFFYSLH